MHYDGSFIYGDKKIGYLMQDEIKNSLFHGQEMITRFIDFFNEDGTPIGSCPCYGIADEMTTITSEKALNWYKEMISGK